MIPLVEPERPVSNFQMVRISYNLMESTVFDVKKA